MSKLHDDLIDKHGKYTLSYNIAPSSSESSLFYYFFHVITNNKNIMSGLYIPLGNFDTEKNVFVLSDISRTLDKNIVDEVKNIRNILLENDIDIGEYKVITRDNLFELIKSISSILNMEILIDTSNYIHNVTLVTKVLITK